MVLKSRITPRQRPSLGPRLAKLNISLLYLFVPAATILAILSVGGPDFFKVGGLTPKQIPIFLSGVRIPTPNIGPPPAKLSPSGRRLEQRSLYLFFLEIMRLYALEMPPFLSIGPPIILHSKVLPISNPNAIPRKLE